MPRLCVPIFVRTIDQARRDALQAIEHGAEMVELRIDPLLEQARLGPTGLESFESAGVAQVAREVGVPCIVTCRSGQEGGLTQADDGVRFTTLARVAHEFADAHGGGPPIYIDVEWSALRTAGGWPLSLLELVADRPGTVRTILSSHDLTGRPPSLLATALEMSQSRGDVVKLVWRARSVRDNVEAFEILREAAKPTICLCAGEHGLMSRILARKFGAFLGFAPLNQQSVTAEGQVPVDMLKRLYGWDRIGRDTRVFGLVAHPVNHSHSPHVHNAGFEAADVDAVYVPLSVAPGFESLKATLETLLDFAPLDLTGLSVTLPHKQDALRWALERGAQVSETAHRAGGVNTLFFPREEGVVRVVADNTDFEAILDTLTTALGCERGDLAGEEVAVIGAGGTGRCAVAALLSVGCRVRVYNRTPERAEQLARELDDGSGSIEPLPLTELHSADARVFVNTTSVGQPPHADQSPFGENPPRLGPDSLVFDVVYNPRRTRLIEQASAAGARTVNGESMFLHQAAAQFRIWTGQEPPLEAMRRAFEQAVG